MNSPTQPNDLLALKRPAVAVKFQDAAPDGVPMVDKAAASGCTYWKLAGEGRTFYTEAEDHYGCPVGSYTHGIDLPEDEAKELEGLVSSPVRNLIQLGQKLAVTTSANRDLENRKILRSRPSRFGLQPVQLLLPSSITE